MNGPDFIGCSTHGLAEWVIYHYTSGRVERRCLACIRERTSKTHYHGTHCRRGHLKTPWTWRRYGPSQFGRCLTCQYERQRYG